MTVGDVPGAIVSTVTAGNAKCRHLTLTFQAFQTDLGEIRGGCQNAVAVVFQFLGHVLCLNCAYYKGSGAGAASTSVIVYPLSQRTITRQQQGHDVTLASLVGVLHAGGLEPANFERASQGIDLESPDGS